MMKPTLSDLMPIANKKEHDPISMITSDILALSRNSKYFKCVEYKVVETLHDLSTDKPYYEIKAVYFFDKRQFEEDCKQECEEDIHEQEN